MTFIFELFSIDGKIYKVEFDSEEHALEFKDILNQEGIFSRPNSNDSNESNVSPISNDSNESNVSPISNDSLNSNESNVNPISY